MRTSGHLNESVGVRERNRLELRRRLSETATAMFLSEGFDAVRVADVAAACGVSTKTVWNHFPTKESLLMDRGDRLATALREATHTRSNLLGVVVSCIHDEIDELATGPAAYARDARAFVALVETNPGLRAAVADRVEQLTRLAADALAVRTGTPATSAHHHIAAGALISLWRLHLTALLEADHRALSLADTKDYVRQEVSTGADLVARLLLPSLTEPALRRSGL
ncbi:TetR/AcrR family transcriptional regulator [Geodermatophilaceae bacterium NBWT11]|nr:TetR/AcrR family transcriptional regulator [Geodermatophilaceae bacterium NBWT11]